MGWQRRVPAASRDAAASGDEQFDLIYVRFLLTHLLDPSLALTHICERQAPGGALVVEDIDFTGSFCHPDNAAYDR